MSWWDDIWGEAEKKVNEGLDQFKAVGVPAIQAGLEQWGIDVLTKQHNETTAKLNEGIREMSAQPSTPLGTAFASVAKESFFTVYGHYVIFGIAAVGIGGYLLLKK